MLRTNEAEGGGVNINNAIHKQYLLQYSLGVHLSSPPVIERENIMLDRFHGEESEHLDLDYITSIVSHPNHPKKIVIFRLSEADTSNILYNISMLYTPPLSSNNSKGEHR